MKTVTSEENMPKGEHYAILEFYSIHIPGDERSKTNPGHGYPAHSEPGARYLATENEQEWKTEILHRTLAKDHFVAFKAGPLADIKVNVEVT